VAYVTISDKSEYDDDLEDDEDDSWESMKLDENANFGITKD